VEGIAMMLHATGPVGPASPSSSGASSQPSTRSG
jgi:hypothetical protein